MRKFMFVPFVCVSLGIGVGLLAQGRAAQVPSGPVPGDHSKVPPSRVPSIYLSSAEHEEALGKFDAARLSSPTGGSVSIGKGYGSIFRRASGGPQYAITHTSTLEYIVILKGTATFVTGGTLIPPIIDTDIYPNSNKDATIRSFAIKDGLAREVGPGDVIVNPPGTPHWFSKINGAIDYAQISVANVDPAPGIERAIIAPK